MSDEVPPEDPDMVESGTNDAGTHDGGTEAARSRRRRQVSVTRRPWLALGVGLLGLGAAVAVPLLAVEATQTLSDSTVGEIQAPIPLDRLPDTPAALVAVVDETGEVASLAVFASAPSGEGGTVILVPAGSAINVAGSATKVRLASLYQPGDEGLAELSAGVEELLGITLNDAVVVDEAALASLLEPYGPFEVDLPGVLFDSVAGADTQVVMEAGPRQLSSGEAAQVLAALPTNESETARLPNVDAVWQAVARAIGDGDDAQVAGGPDGAAADLARSTLAGPVRVRALSAVPVLDLAANPDELDLLEVDGVEILELVARAMPGSVSPVSNGLRIKLVDATGRDGAVEDAVVLLTYFGVAVVWIDDASQQATTVVGYRNPDDVGVFRELESVFGEASLQPSERPIEGVDATITLGESFPEFSAEGRPIPVETVATTVGASPVTFTLQPGDSQADDDGE